MAKSASKHKVRTIVCAGCGETVTARLRPNQRFCSLTCYRSAPSRPRRRTGREIACEWCESTFYRARSQTSARFCSVACHNAHQSRNKTTHTCRICGATFRWSPSRVLAYNPTYCTLACRNADPALRERLLAMNAAQQLASPTKPERIGYEIIERIGAQYDRQAVIGGKFAVDAALPEHRLIVEFDGDYWHDRAGTSTEPRVLKRVALDRSQQAYAEAAGWTVLHLWESDLIADPDGCERRIREHLRPPS